MKMIKSWQTFNESTSHYLPSLSDDGTADHLSDINKRVSVVQNQELRDVEQQIMDYKPTSVDNPTSHAILQKWMYANMITTSLQRGFFIEADLIEKAKELYKEVISDVAENIDAIQTGNVTWDMFSEQVDLVLSRLYELSPMDDGNYYSPYFMEKDVDQLPI